MTNRDPETIIREQLKGLAVSRQETLADRITTALDKAGVLWEDASTVEVTGARVPVETVQAYGLTIRLDACGNAVQIATPYRLEPVE